MTIGYWCVLAAAVLPQLFVLLTGVPTKDAASRWGKGYDNREPREYLAKLEGWRRRARAAEANGYEAFAPFAAAVIIAHLTHAPPRTVDLLALAFVACRLAHGAFYIADLRTLRSLIWFGGVGATLALFLSGA